MMHVPVDLVHPDSCELRPFMWNHQVTRMTKASTTSLSVVDIQCPIHGGYYVRLHEVCGPGWHKFQFTSS